MPHSATVRPGDRLTPEMPATVAAAKILGRLLEAIREHEPGVAADGAPDASEAVDAGSAAAEDAAEHLHDYRVAIRRTRTALARFGKALPKTVRKQARSEFAALGRATGTARDLDVLREALPGYSEMLPDRLRSELIALESRIDTARALERDRFVDPAATAARHGWLDAWAAHLQALAPETAGRSCKKGRTFADVAARAIRRTWRRVFEQAGHLGDDRAEEALHRLRIRCKGLRYVLEFSRSSTPGGEVEAVISALKAVQDDLGELQDLRSHRDWLAEAGDVESASDMGGELTRELIAEIERRRVRLEPKARRNAARFVSEAEAEIEAALTSLARKA